MGTGDFNGDGKADILWRNTSTADVAVTFRKMHGHCFNHIHRNLPSNWTVAGVGDFNGDGKTDILWRNNNTGDAVVSLFNGLAC